MITLSLNFDGKSGNAAQVKKVRELIGTHLGFPGSDKLKLDVTIKDNGSSSVSFAGPKDVIAEAKRLWHENVAPAAKKLQNQVKTTVKPVVEKVKARAKAVAKPVAKAVKVKKAAPKKKTVKATVKVTTAKKKKK